MREARTLATRQEAAKFNTYEGRPLAFMDEVLGSSLWSKQREIVESVWANRYTAVHSAHDVGKSFTAGQIAAAWLATYAPGTARVVSTAPTFGQVRAILWLEIARAHRKGHLPGRINQTEWWLDEELVAFGRKPADTNPDAFQGIHAEHVLVIIDEACGVPKTIYDAADSLVTNEGSAVLAIGNPDDPSGQFRAICKPGSGWNVIHVDGLESPNFTREKVPAELRPLLLSPTWVEERLKRWGETSPLYESKVRGRFPAVSEHAVIPLAWAERARERWLKFEEDLEAGAKWAEEEAAAGYALGVDVARGGGDATVIAARHGSRVWIAHSDHTADTMETTGNVVRIAGDLNPGRIGVDVVGIGAGVFDRLVELGLPAEPLNAGWGTTDFDERDQPRFVNIRSQWWWQVRELFDPAAIERTGEALMIDPDDDDLVDQLTQLQWSVTSRGRIAVESKDDMAKRGLSSPDRADALMHTIARAPDTAEEIVTEDGRAGFGISPV